MSCMYWKELCTRTAEFLHLMNYMLHGPLNEIVQWPMSENLQKTLFADRSLLLRNTLGWKWFLSCCGALIVAKAEWRHRINHPQYTGFIKAVCTKKMSGESCRCILTTIQNSALFRQIQLTKFGGVFTTWLCISQMPHWTYCWVWCWLWAGYKIMTSIPRMSENFTSTVFSFLFKS